MLLDSLETKQKILEEFLKICAFDGWNKDALLKAVSVSWRMHDQTKHAQEIAKTSEDLFKKVAKFVEHLKNIGSHLARTNNAFNDAVGSYRIRILPMKRRLAELGIQNDKELLELQEIESDPNQKIASISDGSN